MSIGHMISDRSNVKSVPELDVKDPDLARELVNMPLSKVDSRVAPYEPSEEIKDLPFDLKPKGLELHFGEYLTRHSLAADSDGWLAQFKKLLPGVVGDSNLLLLGGEPIATFRRDARLSVSKLAKEQPHIIAKYTRMKYVEVFDEEAFKKEMPDVHAAYRGRSFRLKKKGPGAGLVLPS